MRVVWVVDMCTYMVSLWYVRNLHNIAVNSVYACLSLLAMPEILIEYCRLAEFSTVIIPLCYCLHISLFIVYSLFLSL